MSYERQWQTDAEGYLGRDFDEEDFYVSVDVRTRERAIAKVKKRFASVSRLQEAQTLDKVYVLLKAMRADRNVHWLRRWWIIAFLW